MAARSDQVIARRLAPAEAVLVWPELEARLGSTGLACGWAWTRAWLEVYGRDVPHRFLLGEVAGQAVGIALLTGGGDVYPPVVGARTAHVGTAGEPRGATVFVERNRLLVAPEHRDAFAAAVLVDLGADRRWDRLVIPGLVEEDAAALARADPRLALEPRDSPVTELSAGEDPVASLRSGPRSRVRRALRELEPLSVDWAEDTVLGHAILDELVVLHQRRWTADGEPGAFADPRVLAFHRLLVDGLEPGRGVILVRVRQGAQTLGCVYGQVEDGRVLFYQSGLVRSPSPRANVGMAVHACALRACAERGLTAYDYLAPAVRYKRDLATRTDTLVWATLERRRPRTALDQALRQLQARRADRAIS